MKTRELSGWLVVVVMIVCSAILSFALLERKPQTVTKTRIVQVKPNDFGLEKLILARGVAQAWTDRLGNLPLSCAGTKFDSETARLFVVCKASDPRNGR